MTEKELRRIAHNVLDHAIDMNLIRLFKDESIPERPRWVMKIYFLGMWLTLAQMPAVEDGT